MLGLDQGHVFPRRAADHGLLIGQVQAHGVDVVDVPLVPGVDGLAQQGQLPQRPRPQPQRPGGLFPQQVQVAVYREGKVGNLDHVETPLLGYKSYLFFQDIRHVALHVEGVQRAVLAEGEGVMGVALFGARRTTVPPAHAPGRSCPGRRLASSFAFQ